MITESFLDELKSELRILEETHLLRQCKTVEEINGLYAKIKGKWKLLFCGNDYLGLSQHPKVKKEFQNASEKWGVGSGAARLISGSSEPARKLEQEIAKFKKREAALTFSSGYLANIGIISALCGKKDVVIVDKLSHACVVDGAKLSGATFRVFPHNNLEYLEKILKSTAHFGRKLIVTDSVFSMDGDLALLPELVKIKNQYGALLMIDEAHGTGVFGKNGRGAAEHFGVEDEIDISMGTLSKAIGTFGGFVAGDRALIDYLINHARSFLFSTALPPAVYAASIKAIELIQKDSSTRRKLWENVRRVKSGIEKLGLNYGQSESPIIPVLIGDEEKALKLSHKLFESGYFVPAIRYPTVPRKKARLRISVSALHLQKEIEKFLGLLGKLL